PFRKNQSYEHERELRAVLLSPAQTKFLRKVEAARLRFEKSGATNRQRGIRSPIPSSGIEVAIKPEVLIEAIYLSPQTEEWYKELVISLVRKYRLPIPIFRSQMNVVPEI